MIYLLCLLISFLSVILTHRAEGNLHSLLGFVVVNIFACFLCVRAAINSLLARLSSYDTFGSCSRYFILCL
jgi:bacteriorhodopsin